MNILEAVLNAQNGAAAREAGNAVGLSPDQTQSALAAIIPQLAAGLHRNAAQPSGLESLLGALSSGRHGQYVEEPAMLGRADTIADGNAILGHILGSKDVSRAVAARAESRTGIGADVLKRLLPIAATMVMGALAKRQGAQGDGLAAGLAPDRSGGGDLMGMLTPMLDRDGDGSAIDDVLGGLGKMFGGR